MIEAIKELNINRHVFHDLIMDNISEYIYRKERYQIGFTLVAVYSKEPSVHIEKELRKKLRETDKFIPLTKHFSCVMFDVTQENNYVKAAENLNSVLKQLDYKNNFFLSTVYSNEFHEQTLEMTNKLCDRLEYAIQHQLYNTITCQDYLV